MPLTGQELKTKLWQAADILRGQIDSADYKNYIFSMLFLKRLSDRFDEEVEAAMGLGIPRHIAIEDRDEHQFMVPESAHWRQVASEAMNLGEALNKSSFAIESANAERIDSVLSGINWNDENKLGSPANRERLIRSLLNHFNDLDLSDANLQSEPGETGNVLGDAYEYLIYQFADDAGKKGGEFYTPRSVVRLIVELLQPTAGMRICDPTFGSAGMLIYAADYVEEQGGERRNLTLHGQERNLSTFAIGKLNLLLHDLASAQLVPGDVIAEPGLVDDDGRLLSYDRVIANPPFSLKNWGHEFAPSDPHHRFLRYGAIPPRTRGDLAFLLHMLAVTNATGMVGVVMPHGVLFRGGAEGKIRRGIIESDLFEAVIGLAPNLFFGASIPVALCVLNKDKAAERRGKVLFVDASQEGYYRQEKAQNILDREHVEKIVAAFRTYEDKERFAHVADLEEIAANDYNLNISRYVDTAEPVVVLSVEEALANLREAERRRDEAVARMDELLAGMGYAR